MADSRDKPELETLSYEPAWAPSAIEEKNTPVIKPETRANKGEVAGQHPEYQNLIIITEIEGLISQVNGKLWQLRRTSNLTGVKQGRISRAFEEIDLFQKTTLFDLRKAFE